MTAPALTSKEWSLLCDILSYLRMVPVYYPGYAVTVLYFLLSKIACNHWTSYVLSLTRQWQAIFCIICLAQVVWLKDGARLQFDPAHSQRQRYNNKEAPNIMTSTVYIESMSFSDNGHYVCYIPGASKDMLINIEGTVWGSAMTLFWTNNHFLATQMYCCG